MSLLQWAAEHLEEAPDKIAFRFLPSGDSDEQILLETRRSLDVRARCVALALTEAGCVAGDRALLLYPPGLDFIGAFVGCLYAGVVAVPAYPPDPASFARTVPRLRAIASDAQVSVVLTCDMVAQLAQDFSSLAPELAATHWIATDTLAASDSDRWRDLRVDDSRLAFLQYTSGSTRTPRGVMVTHANLQANIQAIAALGRLSADSCAVSWLPTYHDMGLVGAVLAPLATGFASTLMPPAQFLRRPVRWLEAISTYRGTSSAFPNFALDLCVRKVSLEQSAGLDLSSWVTAWNGAEPVRAASLDAFAARFAANGFQRHTLLPVYGLAESTLIATGGPPRREPALRRVSKTDLAQGLVTAPALPAEGGCLVGCGRPLVGTTLRIVDPERCTTMAPGEVGEIWLAGPSVAAGYWNRKDESAVTFSAMIKDTGEGPFLRTGDLGFLADGQLFFTARRKDVIVVRGTNYWPQDIEEAAEQAHECVRPGSSAAVSLDDDGEARLAVAVEVKDIDESMRAHVALAIRRAVALATGLTPASVALISVGQMPKTSSGKVQRHACREGLLAGTLATLHRDDMIVRDGELAPPDISTTKAQIVAVLARVSGYSPSAFAPSSDLLSLLGLDSLLAAEMTTALEATFGRLGQSLFHGEKVTVDDLVARVTTQLAKSTETRAECSVDDFAELAEVRTTLHGFESQGIANPYFASLEGAAKDTVTIAGDHLLNFATYNYLGLADDARVKASATAAIEKFGTSASASRVASGDRPLYRQLEQALASFLGCEAALVFASGHATNVSVLATLVGPHDLVIHDSLAHESVLSGIKLSGARRLSFAHNDIAALEHVLQEQRSSARRVLIVVEGVYSMDGDLAPLRALVDLKRRYGALLYVDEAHSIGCVGSTGRGLAEYAGVDRGDVDVWMGTLSKALASCGGYVCGSQNLIDILKYKAGGFVYAAAISPANAAAALAALEVLQIEPERVSTLQQRATSFRKRCVAIGVDTGTSRDSGIVPVILGSSVHCLRIAEHLRRAGVHAPPIIPPAVEEGGARLRFFLSAMHTEDQLEYAVAALAQAIRACG